MSAWLVRVCDHLCVKSRRDSHDVRENEFCRQLSNRKGHTRTKNNSTVIIIVTTKHLIHCLDTGDLYLRRIRRNEVE